MGISKREYPQLDIAALSRDEAIGIYYRDWWLRFRLGELPGAIARKILDLGTDTCDGHAIKCLLLSARRGRRHRSPQSVSRTRSPARPLQTASNRNSRFDPFPLADSWYKGVPLDLELANVPGCPADTGSTTILHGMKAKSRRDRWLSAGECQ